MNRNVFQMKEYDETLKKKINNNPNKMEISSLPDEELKVVVTNMPVKLGKRINELSENFNKEIENIRKYQTEVTELKNTITELNNILELFKSIIDEVEEMISEFKDKSVELSQGNNKYQSQNK